MTPDVQLHSNGKYWSAVWYEDGVRIKRGLGSKRSMSRIDATGACARIAQELQLDRAGGLPLIADLDERVAKPRPDLKPKSRELLTLTIDMLREWARAEKSRGERLRIDDITRADATAFRAWLFDRRTRGGKPLSPATIASHLRRLRTLWNWVGDDLEGKHALANPWARRGWRTPEVAQDWHEVTPADLAKLMAACDKPAVATLLALCRLAGLRAGEARRLRVRDVDLARRQLTVLPEANARGIREEGTKQRRRIVPVRPELADILAAATKGMPSESPVCDDLPNVNNLRRYLLGAEVSNRPLASGKPRRYVGVLERAGMPAWSKPLHTLRRNCGTEWAEQGIPLADLAKWMGNSPAVAARYYVRTTPYTFARVTGLPQNLPQTGTTKRGKSR